MRIRQDKSVLLGLQRASGLSRSFPVVGPENPAVQLIRWLLSNEPQRCPLNPCRSSWLGNGWNPGMRRDIDLFSCGGLRRRSLRV